MTRQTFAIGDTIRQSHLDAISEMAATIERLTAELADKVELETVLGYEAGARMGLRMRRGWRMISAVFAVLSNGCRAIARNTHGPLPSPPLFGSWRNDHDRTRLRTGTRAR